MNICAYYFRNIFCNLITCYDHVQLCQMPPSLRLLPLFSFGIIWADFRYVAHATIFMLHISSHKYTLRLFTVIIDSFIARDFYTTGVSAGTSEMGCKLTHLITFILLLQKFLNLIYKRGTNLQLFELYLPFRYSSIFFQ